MKYVINLFGTGIRVWSCQIDHEVFDDMTKIKLKHHVEWENLLFNLDFLNHYGFNHWSELSRNKPKTGFLLKTDNFIEIKQSSIRIAHFKSIELDEKQVLFHLYRTEHVLKSEPSIENHVCFKLLQFEKGLIGKFRFSGDFFHSTKSFLIWLTLILSIFLIPFNLIQHLWISFKKTF